MKKNRGKRCGLCREPGHRVESCDLREVSDTSRVSAGQATRRERALERTMLTLCPVCRVTGPTARLGDHLAVDHGIPRRPVIVWAESA